MGRMMKFGVFYGEDPEVWVSVIETFAANEGLSDFETRQLAYDFIGGEAHTWYRDEVSRSPFYSWEGLKFRLIQRFSTRSESEKAKLEWQYRLKQLDRINEWLERRYPEKSMVEKQQEEATLAPESESKPNQVLCHGEGTLKIVHPVQGPIPLVTKPEEEDEIHLSVTDTVKNTEIGKESPEGPLASMDDLHRKAEPAEIRANMRKKKKRWKKRDLQTQNCSGKNKNYAYQVFDQMFVGEKRVKKKRKKKTMKGTKPSNQYVSARRPCQRLNCRTLCLIVVLNKRFHLSFMKNKRKLRLVEHDILYGTLYLRGKRVKMKSKRGSLTKSKWWKPKAKEDKSETQRLQKKNVFILGRKRVTERRKRVRWVPVNTHQKFSRQWLLSFIKKKKVRKKLVCDKKSMKLFHTRSFAKLAGDVTVLKQSAKGKRMKFERNHKKQKKWIKKLISAYLWSDQWLQLNVLVKLSGQWLLAVDKFGLHKKSGVKIILVGSDKLMRGGAELLMLSITVKQLKDQGKPNKRNVKREKMRRWKYKLAKMELPLQLFLVKKDGTNSEIKSVKEGGKCSHKTVKLTWLSCNKSDSVLPQELDSDCISLVLQWPVTLKSIKVKWKEPAESSRIQTVPFAEVISGSAVSAFLTASQSEETTEANMDQELKGVTHILQKRAHAGVFKAQTTIRKLRGLLGSVFLVRENDDVRFLELVKKSVTATHSFELRNRVWEPGIVAYIGEWEEFEAFSNGVLDDSLRGFLSKLVVASKGALINKLRGRHYLTSVSELISLVLFHLTYVMLHSPRPPEWLGTPYHDCKSEKSESSMDCTSCFRFTTFEVSSATWASLCCSEVLISEQEEIEEKRCQFSPFNLEDKVNFKGGGIVTCTDTAVHG